MEAFVLGDSDIDRIRAAIAAYFRAAGALADASILVRLVAAAGPAPSHDAEEESVEEWLLDRGVTYREKSEHMSRSGSVLLSHAWEWIDELEQSEIRDEDASLAAFARAIEDAAAGYAEVVEALTATPLGHTAEYQELLGELRLAVRFLQMEAAAFDAFPDDELS